MNYLQTCSTNIPFPMAKTVTKNPPKSSVSQSKKDITKKTNPRATPFILPIFLAITLLSTMLYMVGQQIERSFANDPQIQLAEDVSRAMMAGTTADEFISPEKIDISESLAPFIIIYDNNQKLVATSATINGKEADIPHGVLQYASEHGTNLITWQATPSVRMATVVQRVSGNQPGYVVVGRSLREIEKRTRDLLLLVVTGWGITSLITLGSYYLLRKRHDQVKSV